MVEYIKYCIDPKLVKPTDFGYKDEDDFIKGHVDFVTNKKGDLTFYQDMWGDWQFLTDELQGDEGESSITMKKSKITDEMKHCCYLNKEWADKATEKIDAKITELEKEKSYVLAKIAS